MEKKIRLGHIGMSHDHSGQKLATARKYPDIFEIVGICEEKDAVYERLKNHPDYQGIPRLTTEQFFNSDLDAVLVEGFELDLVRLGQMCIDNDLPIHLDKPAGDDIVAFEKLLRDAKRKHLTVQLGYMYRNNPAVEYALKAVREGKLGEIYEVDAIMNTGHWLSKRQWLKCFDAGIMFFLGCHMVDFIHMFQGTPNNIIPFNRSTHFDNTDVIDHGFAVFEYDHGVSVARATATECNGWARRQLVICGQKGTIEIKPLETGNNQRYGEINFTEYSPLGSSTFCDRKQIVEIPPVAGRYDSQLMEFAKCVRGEMENPFTYEYELQTQRMVLAACGQDIDYKAKIEL